MSLCGQCNQIVMFSYILFCKYKDERRSSVVLALKIVLCSREERADKN